MSYSPRRSGFFVTVTPEKLAFGSSENQNIFAKGAGQVFADLSVGLQMRSVAIDIANAQS
jgi:hypothetical protein